MRGEGDRSPDLSHEGPSDEEQQASRLREDWTARIAEATGNPRALHDVAVAWSDTARQVCASLLEATESELRARDDMLARLWQEKREMASRTNAGERRGGPNILRRRHHKRLQAANAQLQASYYRKAYETLGGARKASLRSGGEWPAHLERWEAQGHDLLARLEEDRNVSEALDALHSAHRSLVEALETLAQPVPEELRPESECGGSEQGGQPLGQ